MEKNWLWTSSYTIKQDIFLDTETFVNIHLYLPWKWYQGWNGYWLDSHIKGNLILQVSPKWIFSWFESVEIYMDFLFKALGKKKSIDMLKAFIKFS